VDRGHRRDRHRGRLGRDPLPRARRADRCHRHRLRGERSHAMTTIGRALRAGAAALTLVEIIVGLPAALVGWGTSPVRGAVTTESVRAVFEEPGSDRVIVGVLTIAAWCVWALFLRALAAEFVDARRARTLGRQPATTHSGP